MEQATFLDTLLGTPSAAPSCQPIVFEPALRLASLRESILAEDSLGRGLARSGRVETPPKFSFFFVKLPDGLFLIGVEIQFFHGHLEINALAGNIGR